MGRPRLSKYCEVDGLLISRAFEEHRKTCEQPTSVVRRIVRECWNCNPDFVCVMSEVFPRPNSTKLARAMSDGLVEIPDGTIVFVGKKGTSGAWLFIPKLASIRKLLGASERAVVARVLRRLRPAPFKLKGKLIVTFSPEFLAPYLEFDSRRGRRSPAI